MDLLIKYTCPDDGLPYSTVQVFSCINDFRQKIWGNGNKFEQLAVEQASFVRLSAFGQINQNSNDTNTIIFILPFRHFS